MTTIEKARIIGTILGILILGYFLIYLSSGSTRTLRHCQDLGYIEYRSLNGELICIGKINQENKTIDMSKYIEIE